MGVPRSGPSYLWRGMSLIARPGLRRFVLIPLLIKFMARKPLGSGRGGSAPSKVGVSTNSF